MIRTVSQKYIVARKQHRCDYCHLPIHKSTTYYSSFIVNDEGVWTWKSHTSCDELAAIFFKEQVIEEGMDHYEFVSCVELYYEKLFIVPPTAKVFPPYVQMIGRVKDNLLLI